MHDSILELDGNAVVDSPPRVDWELIWCDEVDPDRTGVCTGQPASGALVSGFFFDPVNDTGDDIFAGAKDSLDINAGVPQDWGWKLGSANDKNDIEHGFVALYQDPADDHYKLYFGSDKLANNGDAAMGFWFLQNDVAKVGDGSFSAGHEFGDLLVQTDFTNGGAVSRIDAYVWVGGSSKAEVEANCAAFPGSIEATAPSQGGLCKIFEAAACSSLGGADEPLCGEVNQGGETAPWFYEYKFPGGVAPSPTFPVSTFFEGGIDLTEIFGGVGIPCVATFLVETRQSQTETSELEDLLLGGFELCGIDVTKTGPEKSKVGEDVDYMVTVENTGISDLDQVSITDSLAGDLSFQGTCGATLPAGATCTINYTYTVEVGDPDPLENTVTVVYSQGSDEVTDSDSHSVNLFSPSVTIDKKADGSDGPIQVAAGATVDYSFKVTNTSSADTPTLTCTINDPDIPFSEGGIVLAPGDDYTANTSTSYTPGTYVNTATVSCTVAGFPNEPSDDDSVTVEVLDISQALSVDKTGDDFSKVGDDVHYTVTITNIAAVAVALDSIVDSLVGDLTDGLIYDTNDCPVSPATLGVGEFCTITYTRTTQVGDPDPLINVVTVDFSALEVSAQLQDDHSVDLVDPSLTVDKTCLAEPVPPGASANFRIDIENTGDVSLLVDIDDTLLGIDEDDVMLGTTGGGCTFDNDPSDGCYRIEAGVTAGTDPVFNTVEVLATLPAQYGLANEIEESDDATCDVEEQEGATRTWGFWKTHGGDGNLEPPIVSFGYTCHVFEDHLGGSMLLGDKTLTSCEELFGLFWAHPAKESDGSRRSKLCKQELHTAHQLAAAILNSALDNGTTPPEDPENPGQSIIESGQDALLNDDIKEIIRVRGLLGAYNESGDDVAIVDNDGATIPHADPNGTKEVADYTGGDCPL
jgi:uncharacterized repeat protein (TIGR01451 family)